jgi:hypothetical protein
MTLRKIVSKAVAGTTGAYVGQSGEIFYNSDHGALSISDGVTAGGNPIHIQAESVIYDHNIIPSEDNTFTLGSLEYRWQSIHVGPGTIFITDQTLGTNAELTVDNGVLQINGANQLQVGQLKFVDNTIESSTPDISIEIGDIESTADLVLNRNTKVAAGKTLTVDGVATFNDSIVRNGTDSVVVDIVPGTGQIIAEANSPTIIYLTTDDSVIATDLTVIIQYDGNNDTYTEITKLLVTKDSNIANQPNLVVTGQSLTTNSIAPGSYNAGRYAGDLIYVEVTTAPSAGNSYVTVKATEFGGYYGV